jgi:outer membrane protein
MYPLSGIYLIRATLLTGVLLSGPAVSADLLSLYRSAASDNPSLKVRSLTTARTQAEARVAESRLYPQITLQSSYSHNDYQASGTGTSFNGQRTTLMVRQPLMDIASRHRRDGAQVAVGQAESEAQQARGELFAQLADQYLALLESFDEIQRLQAEKEAATRNVDRLRAMRAREMARVNDLAEAVTWVQQLAIQEIDAMNKESAARVWLREIAGIDPGAPPVMTRQSFPTVSESEQYWVSSALASHPGLSARRQGVEANRQSVAAARAEHLPQLVAFYQRNETNQDIDNAPRPRFSVDSVGLELKIPLYEGGRTSAAERVAQRQLDIANEQLEGITRQVEREVRLAFASAVANRARIDASDAQVDALVQTVKAQERGYELGVVTVVQVLDARRRLLRARSDQSRARYNYLRDLIALRIRGGVLTEADVAEFNRWFGPQPS